jgi:ribosomal protein L37AE/L43A
MGVKMNWEEITGEDEAARAKRAGYKALDYTGTKCKNCGRNRVMNCENGKKVCEKCGWDNVAGEYTDYLTG